MTRAPGQYAGHAAGPGGGRWYRLRLIVLIVLPISAPLGVDGGLGVSDPDESDEYRLHATVGVLFDSGWVLLAPMSIRFPGGFDPHAPVVAGWTCLTPTDRTPPGA